MKSIFNQVKTLKINVKKINRVIVVSNKKIKKISSDKNRLLRRNREDQKRIRKESYLEGKQVFSPLVRAARKIASRPLSLFDRVKNFLEIILTGIIVNNLPIIIKKISEFFDNNKWIIDTIKFVFKSFGNGLSTLIKFVDSINKSDTDKSIENAKKLKGEFERLDKNLDKDNSYVDSKISELEKEQNKNDREKDEQPKPEKTKIKNDASSDKVEVSNPNQKRIMPPSRQPKKMTDDVPKFAKGGKVESNVRNSGPETKKTMVSSSSDSSGSVKSKRAVQTVNYFSFFSRNNEVSEEIAIKDANNKETFKDILTTLKNIQKLNDEMGDVTAGRSTPGGGSPSYFDEAIEIDPTEIIGTVGDTGISAGAHLHIEDLQTSGGRIPRSLVDNILVNGNPVSSGTLTSGIGMRGHPVHGVRKFHAGEDWDQGWENKPITLRNGIKFVGYVPQGSDPRFHGYGNVVIVQNTDGKKYFLAHLNSGPRNLQALKRKQEEKRIARTPKDLISAFDKIRIAAQRAGSPNPDITAAIAMLESGWLSNPNSVYALSGGTNPFGQTGRGSKGFVIGKDRQKHAVYNNLEEGVKVHVNAWRDFYNGKNPRQMLESLRNAGYNKVDPNWVNKIMRIYNQMNRTSSSPVSAIPKSTNIALLNSSSSEDENMVVVNRTVIIKDSKLMPYPYPVG